MKNMPQIEQGFAQCLSGARGLARYSRLILCVTTLAAASVARCAAPSAIDEEWLAKAKTGIRSNCDRYTKLSRRIEVTTEIRADKAPGPAGTQRFIPHTRRERIIRFADNAIREQVRINDGSSEQSFKLECDNADYHFTLAKNKEELPYALVHYEKGARSVPLLKQGMGLDGEVFSLCGSALAALDKGTGLRALSFDNVKQQVVIDFELARAAGKNPVTQKLYFDPNQEWRLVEREVESDSSNAKSQYSYGERTSGLTFPTGCKESASFKKANAPPNMAFLIRVLSIRMTDKKPSDFRLSAFGLPEPVDAPSVDRPTRWYLWILGAAAGCGVLAIGFAWLRRRGLAGRPVSTMGTIQ
jgi:hypothetical protein